MYKNNSYHLHIQKTWLEGSRTGCGWVAAYMFFLYNSLFLYFSDIELQKSTVTFADVGGNDKSLTVS